MNDSVIKNLHNKAQGTAPHVLCVCSVGMLRSATMAVVFQNEYGHNTRCCGIHPTHALIDFSEKLANWADEIYCAESYIFNLVEEKLKEFGIERDMYAFDIPDDFEYMEEMLIEKIKFEYGIIHYV